jgi:hypothetical protein
MIPTKTVLETFGLPQASDLAEENMQEKALAAMAKLKKAR